MRPVRCPSPPSARSSVDSQACWRRSDFGVVRVPDDQRGIRARGRGRALVRRGIDKTVGARWSRFAVFCCFSPPPAAAAIRA